MTANSYPFAGKTIVITGGGSGIGRAVAQAFLDNGANVVVSGRRLAALQETLNGHPSTQSLAVAGDITEPEAAANLIEAAAERFGTIDVVVSNAAAYASGDIQDLSPTDWVTLRSTNIDALFHLAQAALPALVSSRGTLITIASVSGVAGDWGQAAYNATKHAVIGFTRSLALDYGARGVRVNAIAPAFTLTAMTDAVGRTPEALEPFNNRIALGRPGTPEDVAPAVLFLASPDAAYITGTVLTVDGGTSASTGQPHLG